MANHIAMMNVVNGITSEEPVRQSDDVTIGKDAEAVEEKKNGVDYRERGQWLRAAVLGANDGLVSTASLMVGVGAVKQDAKSMALSGVAALVAGACSMAIGEFVSVYTQRDVQLSNHKREKDQLQSVNMSTTASQRADLGVRVNSNLSSTSTDRIFCRDDGEPNTADDPEDLANPIQAAAASALAFIVGALVPLLSAAFIRTYAVRIGVLAGASSIALASFGAVGAIVGGSPAVKASLRVLVGGWIAMLITYGFLRLFASRASM